MSDVNGGGFTDREMSSGDFDRVAALLAEISDIDRHRIEPPPSIWNAIADTVSADRDGRPDRGLTVADGGLGTVAELTSIEEQATTTISLAVRTRPSDRPPLPPEIGTWRRQWLPVAAAVAVAVVGGLVTWTFSDEITGGESAQTGTAASEGDVVAVAEISNDGLPVPATESAEARLVRSGERFFLDLDVPDLAEVDGYYELWITDPEVDGMFSLGVVTGDGRHALPDNLDPADFPVVDVSVEPVDGDPTHSGRSVWRGLLDL